MAPAGIEFQYITSSWSAMQVEKLQCGCGNPSNLDLGFEIQVSDVNQPQVIVPYC
jgi:hypothetical protein